jgi:hypothetical protein
MLTLFIVIVKSATQRIEVMAKAKREDDDKANKSSKKKMMHQN